MTATTAGSSGSRQVHGIAELIVAKQRHGPIGKVTLRFDHETDAVRQLRERRPPARWQR